MAVQQPVQVAYLSEAIAPASSVFRAHKTLPHPQIYRKRALDTAGSGHYTHTTSHTSKHENGAPPSGSLPVLSTDATLPPTPPRQVHHQDRSSTLPPQASILNGFSPSSKQAYGYSSPRGARSPPTPDATPPTTAALDLPLRPTLQALSPSSRADSFRTAKEVLSDEEENEAAQDGEEIAHVHIGNTGAVKSHDRSSEDWGLGLNLQRDDDSTPTPKKLEQASMRRSVNMSQLDGIHFSAIPDREWDTNMMRNVTMRRKNRAVLPQTMSQEDEERVAAREIVPKLFNGSSEDDDGEPTTPINDLFAQTMVSAQRSEERPKRHSGSSHASTALEAIIVPSSPRRRGTLRHVSKTLSLRSDGEVSRPSSNHASIASAEMSMTQLNDALRTEHMRRVNGIHTPDLSKPVPAVALKHHPESRSLRASSGSSVSTGLRRASDGASSSSAVSQRMRFASGGHGQSANAHVPNTTFSFIQDSEPFDFQYDPVAKKPHSVDPTSQNLTRAATRKALQRLDSSAGTLDARPHSFPREAPRIQADTKSMVYTSVVGASDAQTDEVPQQAAKGPQDFAVDGEAINPVPAPESMPRVSFDQSTINVHEMHRASNASSTLRADSEHANARHLFAQSTPFSQISEHEIGEANAINIYPHNNNSLLVVQQVARPSGVQKPGGEVAKVPGWPTLSVQPATPPQQFSSVNVDSPLKNPRDPPLPPIINIHPATPASELDDPPLANGEPVSAPEVPQRSLSLVQKAKRYSDNMMRPIITRTTSLRRSQYRRSRPPREGAPRDSARSLKSEATGLHPFWQPRGFWDDYSDSDSDSDWGEPEQDSGRRLPAGGDTTELGEPRGLAKVLDRRGFGRAFLIGNSLGLERSGTNNKKPMIQVPVGLGQRTSGRVAVRRNSQGTLHTIGSDSLRSARLAKRSVESLHQISRRKSKKVWNPRNWQVHYVGVGGMRDLWRHKQAEKRRKELKGKIGVRYSIENAPTNN